MHVSTHKLCVVEARRIKHPVIPEIEKHYFLVRAKDMATGISTDANARNPEGLSRRIYRDVQESLMGRGGPAAGTFDLLNKGIVCLADAVRRVDDHNYEITIKPGQGIVDGAHTYKIICDAQSDPELPETQCVEFQVRTGVDSKLVTDIARGLNTGIQVRQHSLDNLAGKYDWIKDELKNEKYFDRIAWRESDHGEYDVRDLICVMEALNVFDFPNDKRQNHPIAAYEKWSTPAKKFSDDFDAAKGDMSKSTYHRLRRILREALVLFDTIRREFRDRYNDLKLGRGGNLAIVEGDGGNRTFEFPFAGLEPANYRLTKGALYPIFAAFRNKVGVDAVGNAAWIGGFPAVLELWYQVADDLVRQTRQALDDIGRKPDQIGKNRGHWNNMHQTVELMILRNELKQRANGKK